MENALLIWATDGALTGQVCQISTTLRESNDGFSEHDEDATAKSIDRPIGDSKLVIHQDNAGIAGR